MKTRVTEWYTSRWGINTYAIEKWAQWDDPELLRYYPNAWDWRHVTTVTDKEKAIGIAERLSKDENAQVRVVIAEFGS